MLPRRDPPPPPLPPCQALASRWALIAAALREEGPARGSPALAAQTEHTALALLALCSAALSACPAGARRGVRSVLESALRPPAAASGAAGQGALATAHAAVMSQLLAEDADGEGVAEPSISA